MTQVNALETELQLARKLFWLAANDYIFFSNYNDDKKTWDEGAYPVIDTSDVFVPGAHGVGLDSEDVDIYIEIVKDYGDMGSYLFCAAKHGFKPWRYNRETEDWHKKLAIVTEKLNQQKSHLDQH